MTTLGYDIYSSGNAGNLISFNLYLKVSELYVLDFLGLGIFANSCTAALFSWLVVQV